LFAGFIERGGVGLLAGCALLSGIVSPVTASSVAGARCALAKRAAVSLHWRVAEASE